MHPPNLSSSKPNCLIDDKTCHICGAIVILFLTAFVLSILYAAFTYPGLREMHETLPYHEEHDERQVLRIHSDVVSWRRISIDDDGAVIGDEYRGKVDEWGLFPEKACEGEAGVQTEAMGECKEWETSYGTIAW